jgi:hypothetical protein
MSTIQERIPGYELSVPTPTAMFDLIARYVDSDEATAIWGALCGRVGIDPDASNVDPEEAMRMIDVLEAEGGVFASCAKGLRVRVMTFLVLSQRTAA